MDRYKKYILSILAVFENSNLDFKKTSEATRR